METSRLEPSRKKPQKAETHRTTRRKKEIRTAEGYEGEFS
jgi:hypothetical protein